LKRFITALLFLFASSGISAQTRAGVSYVEDFNLLINSLQELHPLLYTNITKEQFDTEVSEISQRLLTTSSRFKAIYIIQELFYKLGNSHAGNISAYSDLGADKVLPFSVYIIGHELYIKNYPADTSLNGIKIHAIEKTSSPQLIDSLKIFFASDGNRDVISYNLQLLFNNLYGAFSTQKDTFTVNTEKGIIKMAAATRGSSVFEEMILKTGDAYFGKDRFLQNKITSDYGYFRFASFASNYKGYPIEDSFYSFIKEANSKQLKNIVIDLRYNSGGDPFLAGRMTSYLSDHPFRIFERIFITPARKPTFIKYMSQRKIYRVRGIKSRYENDDLRQIVRFEKGLKLKQPHPERFKGKIYIITGSVTQSSSTMVCKYLMDQPNVIFVGSESIGSVNYFWANNLCTINLPDLETVFAFGLELIELKEGSSKKELPVGLIPDHKIEYTISDLIQGKDKEMEFIKNDLKK
jgi:hypothetical protein